MGDILLDFSDDYCENFMVQPNKSNSKYLRFSNFRSTTILWVITWIPWLNTQTVTPQVDVVDTQSINSCKSKTKINLEIEEK